MALKRLMVVIGGQDRSQAAFGSVAKNADKLHKNVSRMGRSYVRKVTAPLLIAGTLATNTAMGFEAKMNKAKVLSKANTEQFAAMSSQARKLGASTVFSAGQVADAMAFQSMAGFKVNETLAATPGILHLAAAAGEELGRSADIASNILTGFNLSADKMNMVGDVLTGTFTSTNTTLDMLGEGMKMVATSATGMKIPLTEVSTVMGTLGNAGIQGTMAGTAMRGMLSKIAKPSGEAIRALKRLKLKREDFVNSEGNVKGYINLVEKLEKSGATASDMLAIFGERAGPAMQGLVNQGSEALRKLNLELINSGGLSEHIAKEMNKGLAGELKNLKSAFEELQIAVMRPGTEGSPLFILTTQTQELTSALRDLGETNPKILDAVFWGGAGLAGVGAGIFGLAGVVWSVKTIAPLMAGIAGSAATFAKFLWAAKATLGPIAIALAAITDTIATVKNVGGTRTRNTAYMLGLQGTPFSTGPLGGAGVYAQVKEKLAQLFTDKDWLDDARSYQLKNNSIVTVKFENLPPGARAMLTEGENVNIETEINTGRFWQDAFWEGK